MLNPDINKMTRNGSISHFSLVTATAKLARDIVDDAKANNDRPVDDKEVTMAMEKILNGDCGIIESADLHDNK